MRVVAMFRVSTERQAEEGASLDAQERRYRELAETNAWRSIGEFRGCESATQAATERHVLQQVLACVRAQEPDALYVHEQSRLTRGDELEVAMLFRELRERGIKIIVGGVIRDLNSIDERFMVGIQSLVDRAEADRMRERSRRGKREKARQGKKNTAGAAFGYANPPKGDSRRGTLQIVPERAAVVRRVFELAASGMGKYAVSQMLNAEALPAPKATQWGPTSVQHVLENPVYIGIHATNVWVKPKGSKTHRLLLRNPDAIVVENAHEPIIPRDLWNSVHGRPKLPTTRKPNLLTGLLFVCGIRYAGDSTNRQSYYRSAEEKGHPWLPVETTNEAVWNAFAAIACQPKLIDCLISEAQDAKTHDDASTSLESHRRTAAKLEARLDRLVDMRADGEISKGTYLQKVDETRQRLSAAKATVARLQAASIAPSADHLQRVVKALQVLTNGSTRFSDQQKRQVLMSIVRRVDLRVARRQKCDRRSRRGRFSSGKVPHWRITGAAFDLGASLSDGIGHLDRPRSFSATRRG